MNKKKSVSDTLTKTTQKSKMAKKFGMTDYVNPNEVSGDLVQHLIDITNENLNKSYNQVKNELKNYSSQLMKKKELIVLNKTDLMNGIDKTYKDFLKNHSKKL